MFDLSKEQPTCIAVKITCGDMCGCKPSSTGGTSNYWGHLFAHHRAIWLEKKRAAGQLTDVGQEELATLADLRKNWGAATKNPSDPLRCWVRRCVRGGKWRCLKSAWRVALVPSLLVCSARTRG